MTDKTTEEKDLAAPLNLSDVEDMRNALTVADEIEKRAIARGYLWMKMTNHRLLGYFHNSNGFSVKLQKYTLGNPVVEFIVRDEQGDGNWMTAKIPASALFEDSEESKEYAEFVRLSKKYGKMAHK